MKRIALVLCAVVALGSGAVAGARGQESLAPPAAGSAVGTARAVDETTLTLSDAGAPAKVAKNAAGSNTLAYFIRMVVVLALVLGAIYGVFRLMKRLSRSKGVDSSAIKLLASTSLGTGKALHVVGLGSKAYLIGATDSSISLVATVEDKELLDALALEVSMAPQAQKPGSARDFGEMLSGLMGSLRGGQRRKTASRRQRDDGDFLAGQRERLRKF